MRKGRDYPQAQEWGRFSPLVYDHIVRTYHGHYPVHGEIEPLAFFESRLDSDYLSGQVCKYALRVKKTRSVEDLFKAAQYLAQLHKKIARENARQAGNGPE